MKKVILEVPLLTDNFSQKVQLPLDFEPLSAIIKDGVLTLFVLTRRSLRNEIKTIHLVTTGVDIDNKGVYFDTFEIRGTFYHLFIE